MSSGIIKFISKISVQDMTYWEFDGNDGYGQSSYKVPVNVKVRWTDEFKTMTDNTGKEIISEAFILSPNEFELNSKVKLISLADLQSQFSAPTDINNPANIEQTYTVQSKEKIPLLKSTTEFVNLTYLSKSK